MYYCDEFPGLFTIRKPMQLELPLIYDDDLYPLHPTIFDSLDKEYYVTFWVGESRNATMSGKIIGRRKNGKFIVDPGGSGYHLFEAEFSDIVNISSQACDDIISSQEF